MSRRHLRDARPLAGRRAHPSGRAATGRDAAQSSSESAKEGSGAFFSVFSTTTSSFVEALGFCCGARRLSFEPDFLLLGLLHGFGELVAARRGGRLLAVTFIRLVLGLGYARNGVGGAQAPRRPAPIEASAFFIDLRSFCNKSARHNLKASNVSRSKDSP